MSAVSGALAAVEVVVVGTAAGCFGTRVADSCGLCDELATLGVGLCTEVVTDAGLPAGAPLFDNLDTFKMILPLNAGVTSPTEWRSSHTAQKVKCVNTELKIP